MSINLQSINMYTDKTREVFQKNDYKRNIRDNPIEVELMRNKGREKQLRRQELPENNKQINRPSGSINSASNNLTSFEIFKTHTLVTKLGSSTDGRSVKSASNKPRVIIQPAQPNITFKQHYNNNSVTNSDINIKLTRHSTNPEEKRSMSAIVKGQSKGEFSGLKSGFIKPSNPFANPKSQNRVTSASNKSSKVDYNYESLNRNRSRSSVDKNNDPSLIYYSLPRKPKTNTQHQTKHSIKPKPIDGFISHRKHKISIDDTATIAADSSDTNPINFSSTLAKAATNSPPVKRRLSVSIASNSRMPARFASRNTINEIYTRKNYKENQEKFKKAASEILKENLALKFGPNLSSLNQGYLEPTKKRLSVSSSSSLSSSSSSSPSTSSGTDQQISISSIPHDDIPLGIPNKNETVIQPEKEVLKQNQIDIPNTGEEMTDIMQGMVVFSDDLKKNADVVHLSDEDNDEYEEYDFDDRSSSEACSSGSSEDIENLKKQFVPLYVIERMDEDFVLNNGFPDPLHSQSFRVENTSIASNTEVFVYKESLQKAKDALLTEPNQGILSVKLTDPVNKKKVKRKAVIDPHILLLDACLEPDFELAKELVPKVPNISKKTIDGITALHNAVCSAEPKLVLFLLQNGADVNASDADGWTPLHCAACCNNKQISKILVEHGASLFSMTLSDNEIPSQKCNKANQEDALCEEYLFWEQENLGVTKSGIVYALFSYEPQVKDELPLVPNQILKILDTNPTGETGWFLAEDLSQIIQPRRKGFVAAAYVSVYPLVTPQKRPDLT